MTNVITSVSDYLEKLKKITVDEDSQLFYRGVSNEEYATPDKNIPSIYRNSGWIENEDKMFYELVSKVPEEFKDCQNTFEHLVKMQHYGYPTRLLDITSNPLVALYFACTGDNKKDGGIILFNIRKIDIRNYNSDRVALVSTLALVDRNITYYEFLLNELRSSIIKMIQGISETDTTDPSLFLGLMVLEYAAVLPNLEALIEIIENLFSTQNRDLQANVMAASITFMGVVKSLVLYCDNRFPRQIGVLNSFEHSIKKVFNELKKIIDEYGHDVSISYDLQEAVDSRNILEYKESAIKNLNKVIKPLDIKEYSKVFKSYNTLLSRENSTWSPGRIRSSDLIDVHVVHPKYDNPRIVAQQGAFLLTGFSKKNEFITTKPNIEEVLSHSKIKRINIPLKYKYSLLKELYTLGVSESVLFPEIEPLTREIKSKYLKNIKLS